MLKRSTSFLLAMLCVASAWAQTNNYYQNIWQNTGQGLQPAAGEQRLFPNTFQQFYTNEAQLEQQLLKAGADYENAIEMVLPAPDGSYREFRVWRNQTMSPELRAAYPSIHTFSAEDVHHPNITAQLDYTLYGFHAMVFEQGSSWFIDPVTNQKSGYYIIYQRNDYDRPLSERMHCEVGAGQEAAELGKTPLTLAQEPLPELQFKVNGSLRRNYRLAMSCTYEYSVAVAGSSPTAAAVISAITTTVNRINGIYNRELSVNMSLIDITDLVFLTSDDPFNNYSGPAMLYQNQSLIDSVIGNTNYDIGHVFSTGGGGIANLGVVCASNYKAMGVTGLPNPIGDAFDVDYVAHEIGHQFDGDHIFNNNQNGACSGNMAGSSAYEPGGGSTIMGYAGICPPDNLQLHSDPYFHARSLDQMSSFITTGIGAYCGTTSTSPAPPPIVPSFNSTYYIPASTPFELTAPSATSVNSDTLTYTWEQYNRGDIGRDWNNTMGAGPIFRSYPGTSSPTRVFPTTSKLVANAYPYLGEKLPTVSRSLRFKLTVRNIYQGWGSFNLPSDTVGLKVTDQAGPFEVTVPNTQVDWTGGSTQVIQWSVANTNLDPINATHVDIYLSTDGGYTYPHLLMANTPNDGQEAIVVPNNINTTQARIKVKASGNVFFDISNVDFTIVPSGTSVAQVAWADAVLVFPVPAEQEIFVTTGQQSLTGVVTNALGQTMWQGQLQGKTNLKVADWAPGVYYLRLSTPQGQQVVKPLMVQ